MGSSSVLSGTRIVTPRGIVAGHIAIENGKIASISTKAAPLLTESYDAGQNLVLAGFIDLHVHGAGGWEVGPRVESVLNMAKSLAENGTTSFYPTPPMTDIKTLCKTLKAINDAVHTQREQLAEGVACGAEILGIHLEGPFLNKENKGAMAEDFLLPPELPTIQLLEKQAPNLIKRITLAPELPGSFQLIKSLHNQGYDVAAGHTNADTNTMKKGIDAGISIANHLFNAMRPLHHREPGAVGVCLTDDRIICEIIADGIHVHPLAIEIAIRCKGHDNLYLVSDAISAAGLPAGEYKFIGRKINVDASGVSRLEDGTIAGSTSFLRDGFKLITDSLNHDLLLASKLTAVNPAKTAGLLSHKGTLEEGKDADIVVLDQDYSVTHSCVKGVWHKVPPTRANKTI